jgi:hypothetical protein
MEVMGGHSSLTGKRYVTLHSFNIKLLLFLHNFSLFFFIIIIYLYYVVLCLGFDS